MRLLLDQNLSPTLAVALASVYPGIRHVKDFSLRSAPDSAVWAHAAKDHYTIVTKDADFHHRSLLYGHPPKVIWIRAGNCSTRNIASLLADERDRIVEFYRSAELSFLALP